MKSIPLILALLMGFAIGVILHSLFPRPGIRLDRAIQPAKSLPSTNLDNGLSDWLADTNSAFGVWAAQSSRIVKTEKGLYQPQFRNAWDTNASNGWTPVFVGNKAYDELFWAQYQLRQVLATQKAVNDGMIQAFKTVFRTN